MRTLHASHTRIPPVAFNLVIRVGHRREVCRGLTGDTALRLTRYFGTDAQSWLTLQIAYDLRIVELASGEAIARQVKPREAT